MERAKTVFLLALMSVLFVFVGAAAGGVQGMLIALAFAAAMNLYSYYYSDTLVLRHYHASEVGEQEAPELYAIVRRLSRQAGLPMPKVYLIPDPTPNAFATGRNPEHAAVAATEGLLRHLTPQEVEGVMAHEMSHVRHYDILVGTIAATMAGAIAMIANILQFGAAFGNRERGGNPLLMIIAAIVLPIAAMMVQMAVSRSREYMADEGAARLTGHPEWLQSALMKLERYNAQGGVQEATPASAHMFIVNPLHGKRMSFASLFSTHPSTQERIARLEQLITAQEPPRSSLADA